MILSLMAAKQQQSINQSIFQDFAAVDFIDMAGGYNHNAKPSETFLPGWLRRT